MGIASYLKTKHLNYYKQLFITMGDFDTNFQEMGGGTTIDEVTERATIEFGRFFSIDFVKNVIDYIARDYQPKPVLIKRVISEVKTTTYGEDGRLIPSLTTHTVRGTIEGPDYEESSAFDFVLSPGGDSFTALKFFTSPGYCLDEHSEEVVVWDKTRALVGAYIADRYG